MEIFERGILVFIYCDSAMRQSVSKHTIDGIIGPHISKLASKGSPEYFVLPIAITKRSDDPFAAPIGQLQCCNLQDIVDVLEDKLGRIVRHMGRMKGITAAQELEDLLQEPVQLAIDKQINFKAGLFVDSCLLQGIDPSACHILMPLHVSENLIPTLDNTQAMYGIDGHVYLTRDYLLRYGTKLVDNVLPSMVDYSNILSSKN